VPVAYHPDFGQVVSYDFELVPEAPDAQVRIACHKLIRWALEDSSDLVIQQQVAGLDPTPQAVFDWVKPRLRFRQDTHIAEDLQVSDPRKHGVIESFIRPADQARLIEARGIGVEDCDGFTGYVACLLTALNIPCSLVTVAAEGDRPYEFSHIYVVAYFEGQRIPMDVSHGPHLGWECPHYRIKEWPVCRASLMPSLFWPLAFVAALAWFALKGVVR